MITKELLTKENLLSLISSKDIKRIKNNENKEYIVLLLHCFNSFSFIEIILTNNFNRYKNVSRNGDAILEHEEIYNIINN